MDGPTLYRKIQAEHPDLVSRIVFMTSHAQNDEYAAFVRDVRAPLLSKPFPREDLDETLGRMMGPTRSRRGAK
jgi:DNA-binding NtrC family response regulator